LSKDNRAQLISTTAYLK